MAACQSPKLRAEGTITRDLFEQDQTCCCSSCCPTLTFAEENKKNPNPECAPRLIIAYRSRHFGRQDNPRWNNTGTLDASLPNPTAASRQAPWDFVDPLSGRRKPVPGLALAGVASTRDAPLGTGGFAQVRAWPQASGVTSTSRRGPALETSAEQPRGVARAIQSRCTPPFLFNACTRELCAAPSIARPTRTPHTHLDRLLLWKTPLQCGDARLAAALPVPSRP